MAISATRADFDSDERSRTRAYLGARLRTLLNALVTIWIFSGGFVLVQPSPYEFMFLLVLPVALFAGLHLYRTTLPILLLIIVFSPFALLAAFQAKYNPLSFTLLFEFITIFLLLTGYFLANYVAEAPQIRVRRIINAYTAAALVSAIIGTAGYLHLIPDPFGILLRYGRVKAFFKDPNVYGPFLVVPAMYALQRVLLGTRRQTLVSGLVVLCLFIGVFVSFSRAAWGHMLVSTIITYVLCFALEANAREKVRMLIIALAGGAMVVVALAGLLSIPSVNSLFSERASVEQNYDTGSTGRFGRQAYAFALALSHPLGIGPGEFRNLRVIEEPHDTYVSNMHVYGWGGAICFDGLILLTLWRAFGALFLPSANRRLLIPLVGVFIPLIIEFAIIDGEHWRHFYLVIGMIWGVTTGYRHLRPGENKHTALA